MSKNLGIKNRKADLALKEFTFPRYKMKEIIRCYVSYFETYLIYKKYKDNVTNKIYFTSISTRHESLCRRSTMGYHFFTCNIKIFILLDCIQKKLICGNYCT